MKIITESEFARLCEGIYDDRETIFKHNPIGSREETLLWMLLGVLTVYLSLEEDETPCFAGVPTAETYKTAIEFTLKNHAESAFDAKKYLDKLIS